MLNDTGIMLKDTDIACGEKWKDFWMTPLVVSIVTTVF